MAAGAPAPGLAERIARIGGVRLGLGLAAAVMALDQATKWWVVDVVMQPPRVIPVTPFFNLVMGWNRGVSFGLFGGDAGLNSGILILVALAIVAMLAWWLRKAETPWVAAAIGLIIGGALGNVLDRLVAGAVADFLDFHVAGYHWPAFNLADTAITIGAAALILDSLFRSPEKPKNGGTDGTDAEQ